MALSVSNAVRTPGVGENVKSFDDGTGAKIQGVAIVDATGNPRIDTNPMPTRDAANPNLAVPYQSAAAEANADNVAAGAITALRKVHFTASTSLVAARWIWITDRAAIAGATLADLLYPPILVPEGGMIELKINREDDEDIAATNLSVGVSSDSDTYAQSGTGHFRITWEA